MKSKQKLFCLICSAGLVIILLLSTALISLAQSGTWTTKKDMKIKRWSHSASVVNGKIYVIGGFSTDHVLFAVEEYDPVTDTWTFKKRMPTSRNALSTCVVNGKIYAIGGQCQNPYRPVSTVEEYNPATDTWTTKKAMPTARMALATSVVNGKIYAIGGSYRHNGNFFSMVEEYDVATDTWTTKQPMPGGARTALCTEVVNGKIYAIGGGCTSPLSIVEEYDPETDTWTTKADIQTPRSWFSTCVVNGRIYAIGGWYNYQLLSTVEVYDTVTDTWLTAKPNMPTARYALSTNEVNGKIYAIGGTIVRSGPPWGPGLTIVEEYTPTFPTVYPYNVQLSSHFMHAGIDTLTINTNVCNPQNHNLMARAMFASVDSAIVDSVLLCDDGNHADGEAGDGLFGCFIAPQSTENEFIIAIKTVDLDTASDCVVENAARFTTIGPVVLDSYTITSSDTFPNPGDRLTFQFSLRNKGLTATAKNVTAILTNLDTCAFIISIAASASEFGDISPGETALGIGNHRIGFLSNCPGNTYAHFRLDIASNGYTFWSDSFKVYIYTTSVRELDDKQKIPAEFVLHQNYPNPFNSSTTIIYSIPEPGLAILKVYDLIGREIQILVNKFVEAGTHSVNFDASDLPSGIYVYKLQADDLMEVRKMLLMR